MEPVIIDGIEIPEISTISDTADIYRLWKHMDNRLIYLNSRYKMTKDANTQTEILLIKRIMNDYGSQYKKQTAQMRREERAEKKRQYEQRKQECIIDRENRENEQAIIKSDMDQIQQSLNEMEKIRDDRINQLRMELNEELGITECVKSLKKLQKKHDLIIKEMICRHENNTCIVGQKYVCNICGLKYVDNDRGYW